jgi:hypothetical protein
MICWGRMLRCSGLAVVLMMIVSSVQCAAACTPVTCSDPPPPCHHHKQTPASQKTAGCAHELVQAAINQSSIDISFSFEAIEAIFVPGAPVRSAIQIIQDASPPGLTEPPLTVLRI